MMSETSSKKFGSELDNLRKWRDGGENSAADATDPASKESLSFWIAAVFHLSSLFDVSSLFLIGFD